MKTRILILLVLITLVTAGGCSSSGPALSQVVAPDTGTPVSDARGTSALNWETPTVLDSTIPVCKPGTSIATIDGNPAVAYQIWSDQGQTAGFTLYFVRANNPAGSSWGDPTAAAFWPFSHSYDSYTSLCEVNGRPAIAYRAMPNGSMNTNLYYVRAKDAAGIRWGTPVIVDPYDNEPFDDEGFGATMLVVNGNPAIWYKDAGSGKYVRALDQQGRNWGSPQILYSPYGSTFSRGFAVVNGRPAVAYGLNGELTFLRAADANGDSWGSPQTVLAADGPYWNNGLAVVDGNPAIAFSAILSKPSSYVRYIRASDADGTAWPSAAIDVTIGGDASVECFQSMGVINGLPSIAFSSTINTAAEGAPPVYETTYLEFVQATESTGSSWDPAQTVVDLGGANGDPRLVAAGSGAGIAFLTPSHAVNYIGTVPAPPDPGAGGFMHLENLSADIVTGKGGRWRASFTVQIVDSSEDPVSGADVAYTVSGDASGSGQIATGSDGTASYQTGWFRDSASVTFTVDDVTHATLVYDPGNNHSGNSISISGP